jgi:hypothetical protein
MNINDARVTDVLIMHCDDGENKSSIYVMFDRRTLNWIDAQSKAHSATWIIAEGGKVLLKWNAVPDKGYFVIDEQLAKQILDTIAEKELLSVKNNEQ